MDKKRYLLPHDSRRLSISALQKTEGEELVFFIHGLGCAKESFMEAFTSPYLKNFSLFAPDLPGFGESSKVRDFSYSMEEHARICMELCKNFPEKKIHIAGHSMGGAIALLMTGMLKGRFTSFINIEGNLIGADCSLSKMVNSSDMKEYRRHMINQLGAVAKLTEDRGVALWHRWLQKAGAAGLYQSARSLVEWSRGDRLLKIFERLAIPAVYIHGERNAGLPVLKQLHEKEKISIPGAGHFPMNDNPDFFYRAVGDFLATRKN